MYPMTFRILLLSPLFLVLFIGDSSSCCFPLHPSTLKNLPKHDWSGKIATSFTQQVCWVGNAFLFVWSLLCVCGGGGAETPVILVWLYLDLPCPLSLFQLQIILRMIFSTSLCLWALASSVFTDSLIVCPLVLVTLLRILLIIITLFPSLFLLYYFFIKIDHFFMLIGVLVCIVPLPLCSFTCVALRAFPFVFFVSLSLFSDVLSSSCSFSCVVYAGKDVGWCLSSSCLMLSSSACLSLTFSAMISFTSLRSSLTVSLNFSSAWYIDRWFRRAGTKVVGLLRHYLPSIDSVHQFRCTARLRVKGRAQQRFTASALFWGVRRNIVSKMTRFLRHPGPWKQGTGSRTIDSKQLLGIGRFFARGLIQSGRNLLCQTGFWKRTVDSVPRQTAKHRVH